MLTDPFNTNRITSTINGAAIRVHRATGPGLLESAYMPCLPIRVARRWIVARRSTRDSAGLSRHPLDAVYRADMLVDDTGPRGAEIGRLPRSDPYGTDAYLPETLAQAGRTADQLQCERAEEWPETDSESRSGEARASVA